MNTEKLTKETCRTLANDCTSREQYKELHPKAYRLAVRAGWLPVWFPIHHTLTKNYCTSIANTCSSRSELGHKNPSVYQKCRRTGWLDEFFPERPRNLTHKFCEEIASKYSSRSELKDADGAVYEASRKNGWLTEFYPSIKHAGRDLTKEFCHSIAKTCNSRSDFRTKDASAYGKSLSNGWLNDFFPITHVRAPYTHDECREIALRCESKSEFKKLNATAYRVSCINGWLCEFDHFKDSRTVRSEAKKKYSDEDIISEAKKYTTLTEFRKCSPATCQRAYKRGLIKKFSWFEQPPQKPSDTIYAYEFTQLGYVYIGRTIYPAKRDAAHRKPGSPVYKFSTKHNIDIPAPKYIKDGLNPFNEGGVAERETIKKYRETGWNLINDTIGGELGSLNTLKYSKKKCRETAEKYTYKKDFLRNDNSIYRFAKAHGYLDSYTWLKSTVTPLDHWTYDNCAKEAAKYETRSEFRACNQGAYLAAKRNGWLDDFITSKHG